LECIPESRVVLIASLVPLQTATGGLASDALRRAVSLYELVEDLLQDVFYVARVGDTSADAVAEPWLTSVNRLRDLRFSAIFHCFLRLRPSTLVDE
jgi:hypothetical protein